MRKAAAEKMAAGQPRRPAAVGAVDFQSSEAAAVAKMETEAEGRTRRCRSAPAPSGLQTIPASGSTSPAGSTA